MLEVHGIRKSYGGVAALKGVDLHVRSGTVHALVGENGAGKSTLLKILVGAVEPDAGTLLLEGQPLRPANSASAARSGVALVSQELALFPDLDILSNLYPTHKPTRRGMVDRSAMFAAAIPVLRELGLEADPRVLVGELPLDQRQLVEIARAVLTHPKVLILDEPTSALQSAETEQLHTVLRGMRGRGVAIVYVSHILEDVLDLCDEITVFREGRSVLHSPRSGLTVRRIVHEMLGGEMPSSVRPPYVRSATARPTLELADVTVRDRFGGVSISAGSGEVVGLAGLNGSGHRDVLRALAGVHRITAGTVRLPNGSSAPPNLRAAINNGVALVSGDRQSGVMLERGVWDNIAEVRSVALGRDGWWMNSSTLRKRAAQQVESLRIKCANVEMPVGALSGGNQQKVVFAKWLESEPELLLLDDPTRGVDVGAKAEIYNLIADLAERGTTTLLVSSDIEELALVCDRVYAFYRGHICAELDKQAIRSRTILHAINTGHTSDEPDGIADATRG